MAVDRLLSRAQVQKLLGVGPTKLYYLTQSGELTSVSVGRLRKFRESDVNAYIEGLSDASQT